MICSKSSFWDATVSVLFALVFLVDSLSVCLTFWPEILASAAQFLKHYFSPFCLELSLAKPGYELCRWAPQGEWRDKGSSQGLATCSPANMPLHQISIIPAREMAGNGRSSMCRNKEILSQLFLPVNYPIPTLAEDQRTIDTNWKQRVYILNIEIYPKSHSPLVWFSFQNQTYTLQVWDRKIIWILWII